MDKSKIANIKNNDPYDVYIGRGSIFGNPFEIGRDGNRDEVIEKYKVWFYQVLKDRIFRQALSPLRGKRLGCFCAPQRCHGEVILEYLERERTQFLT